MRFLLSLVLLSFTFCSIGQDDHIMDFAEVEPKFPGGESAMILFIQNNVNYPETAVKQGEQGIVYVQFIVYKNGSLGDVKVIRGVSPTLDAEAIRVVKMMPNWVPGEQKGKKMNVRYTLPINFQLANKSRKELRAEKKRQKQLLKHNK
ncbi:MAG: energy transducer TonB [Crocinitomicaceae bacterium]